MRTRVLEADDAAPAVGGYAQALEVTGAARTLYISGQVPVAADGSLAAGFAEQCRQAWAMSRRSCARPGWVSTTW